MDNRTTSETARLETIYAPIINELKLVESLIESAVDVESPFVSELLGHVLKVGGKKLRPAITLLAGKFHTYNPDLLIPQAAAVEVLHTATLVHDDIIDRSTTRRGRPTINAKWGDAQAILLGDYLLAKAAELCARTENSRVVRLCAQTLMTISAGELEHASFTFDISKIKEQYYRWIRAKTATLFGMAAESGAILSNASETEISALREYGTNLGMAFQIIDDILDFTGNEAEMGKPTGEDLLQGVVTLPVILYLERNLSQHYTEDIGEAITRKDKRKLRLLTKMVSRSSSIEDCFQIAAGFSEAALAALNVLPDREPKQNLIDLADWALRRKR